MAADDVIKGINDQVTAIVSKEREEAAWLRAALSHIWNTTFDRSARDVARAALDGRDHPALPKRDAIAYETPAIKLPLTLYAGQPIPANSPGIVYIEPLPATTASADPNQGGTNG